jgi:hypothetical protein
MLVSGLFYYFAECFVFMMSVVMLTAKCAYAVYFYAECHLC